MLAATQFMVILDTAIVAIALPTIRTELGFTAEGLPWAMDAYMLALGGLVLLSGRVGDLVGHRRALLAGIVVFVAASAVCALATGPEVLVIARFVQGAGAALAAPAALALVATVFPHGADRNRAMAIFGGIGGIAGPTGLLLGGLLSTWAWQLVFLINLPVGAVLLLLGRRLLPPAARTDAAAPRGVGSLDLAGALFVTTGLCLAVYGAIRAGVGGWGTGSVLAVGAAVILLGAFVVRQLTATSPLLPRELFTSSGVVLGAAACALLGAALYGTYVLCTLHLQQVRGLGPLSAALALLPSDVVLLLGSRFGGRLLARTGPGVLLGGGLLLQAAGLAWLAGTLHTPDLVTGFVLPTSVAALGTGIAVVAVFVAALQHTSPDAAGSVSGLLVMANQVGGALGIAAMSTVAGLGRDLLTGQANALWVAVGCATVAALLALWLRLRTAVR